MPDVSGIGINEVLALPIGGLGLLFAIKVIWPLVRETLKGATAKTAADNQMYINLATERDKATARAEAAEDRADKLFEELQKVRAEMHVLTYQIQMANERINNLRARLGNAPAIEGD